MVDNGFEKLLEKKPIFINIGVGEFGESLREQGFVVLDVTWSPPAHGDPEMMDLLDDLL